jgi:hypothetical protein
MVKKLFTYLEPTLLSNTTGQPSIKRLFAYITFFTIIGLCIYYSKSHFEIVLLTLTGLLSSFIAIAAVQDGKAANGAVNDSNDKTLP